MVFIFRCVLFFSVLIFLIWEELWVMKKQCKRALLSLASICMCLTSGIGIFAENEQTPVTYIQMVTTHLKRFLIRINQFPLQMELLTMLEMAYSAQMIKVKVTVVKVIHGQLKAMVITCM